MTTINPTQAGTIRATICIQVTIKIDFLNRELWWAIRELSDL
jgi:hypothetical protein